MMGTHPPGLFQIDGNLGAANGTLEALVQSRLIPDATEVELLRAVPEQWPGGSVSGVHVRGGAVLDMRWKAGKVEYLEVHAITSGGLRLIPPGGQTLAMIRTTGVKTVVPPRAGLSL
ncbi:MAG: glycoside hydrolase family 95-like protein [Terracidiphilus sp.]